MRTTSLLSLATLMTLTCSLGACSAGTDAAVGTSTAAQTSVGFCPKDLVSRKDMARYLERLKKGRAFDPPAATGKFDDVPDATDARWAEALFGDGITKGCTPTSYCPDDTVPREQMAAFIVRLFHGRDFTRDGGTRFVDVTGDSQQFAGYIEQLADDGITTGCDETHFCPKQMVLREQMAAFLMRAAHPGSTDGPGSGKFGDVEPSSQFAGRIEQAVDEGIVEPCAGSVVVDGNQPAVEKQVRFNVYAKSSIEPVNVDEHAPNGAKPIYGGAAFSALLRATNAAYSEFPSDDWDGAQHDSQKFRLWAYLGIDATCWGSRLELPVLTYAYSDGGSEAGPVDGTHDLETRFSQEGAGWGLRYVLSGSPAGVLEPQFQSIKPRDNTAIFQYGTVHVTCDGNGDPQATFDTYEGPSFGGSSFPTHHSWIFRGDERVNHEHHRIGQSWSSDPDGAGMKDLWFLPAVPPP